MAQKSRTEYSARNTTVAMASRVVAILTGYLARVVFTHVLSEDYVGINGLFTDILNVLSLTELGVGTAITYALYRPVSEGDIEKQKSLMRLYRTLYRVVALVVLAAGLLVIPFFDVLLKEQPQVDHLILIYLMYLLNSVLSYLLVYKRTLLEAHQLSYIGVLVQTVFLILQYVLQIVFLFATRNFMAYLSVQILCTIAGNFVISKKADKMYPYLRDREVAPLPKEERQDIFRNIRAMMMHKVGNVLVNNTDNLLLSSLVGTLSVGRYSNYYLIIGSVRQVLNQMFQGITASVGNLGVEESKERVKRIFEAAQFVGQWMFGLAAICLFEVLDVFVSWSFGSQYVFSRDVTLVLCLNFYLTGMRQATLVFRDSMGIFRYDRYKAIPEALINLVVSMILGEKMGALGIFIGTMVSTVTTSLWVEPYMFYKHRLGMSSKPYFLRYALYAGVTFLLWFLEDLLCVHITGAWWAVCILRLLVCFAITNLLYLLVYHRTAEFRLLLRKAKEMAQKRFPNLFAKGHQEDVGEEGSREAICKHSKAQDAGQGGREATVVGREKGEHKATGGQGERGDQESVGGQQDKSITAEERLLLEYLRDALTGQEVGHPIASKQPDWAKIVGMADKHGVFSLLYGAFVGNPDVPEPIQKECQDSAQRAARQSYRILFLCKYLVGRLEEKGISVVVLKGVGTASYYPVPEIRKTGDVDFLLLHSGQLEMAEEVFLQSGCGLVPDQLALHHVVYLAPGGIEVELHTMLAEPFDNAAINKYLEERVSDCLENMVRADCMGVPLPILDTAYHAYELLLHMLQHFLRSGFGLKLLCDWVVFWNRGTSEEEQEKYMRLVRESGLRGFSEMVTQFCCTYLGLEREKIAWMQISSVYDVKSFLREILDAEEFGRSANDRMVTLRGDGFLDYLREFHHQMCLNFPKGSRVVIAWPALWVVTLFRFLRNNRKIRGVSTQSVLKKAGQRSRIMDQMNLWKEG